MNIKGSSHEQDTSNPFYALHPFFLKIYPKFWHFN